VAGTIVLILGLRCWSGILQSGPMLSNES
jgi:hypothetical protein